MRNQVRGMLGVVAIACTLTAGVASMAPMDDR